MQGFIAEKSIPETARFVLRREEKQDAIKQPTIGSGNPTVDALNVGSDNGFDAVQQKLSGPLKATVPKETEWNFNLQSNDGYKYSKTKKPKTYHTHFDERLVLKEENTNMFEIIWKIPKKNQLFDEKFNFVSNRKIKFNNENYTTNQESLIQKQLSGGKIEPVTLISFNNIPVDLEYYFEQKGLSGKIFTGDEFLPQKRKEVPVLGFSDNYRKQFHSKPKVSKNIGIFLDKDPKPDQIDENMIETSMTLRPRISLKDAEPQVKFYKPTFLNNKFLDKFVNLFNGKLVLDRNKRSILPSTLLKQIGFPLYGGYYGYGYPQSTAGSSLYGSYAIAQSGQGGLSQPIFGGGISSGLEPLEEV